MRYDADTAALIKRERLNDQRSSRNLEDWIIAETKPRPEEKVLDLGCGTGKQIFALAKIVTEEGTIVGFDVATKAVSAVKEKARAQRLKQIRAIRGNLDQCLRLISSPKFDLIISTYAIYYAKDMTQLLIGLKQKLNPRGRIFICGPAKGSNQEMTKLINSLLPRQKPKLEPIKDFISRAEVKKISSHFSKTKIVYLKNKIRFATDAEVLAWWKNHNTYLPEVEPALASALKNHFKRRKYFSLTKNVLGVHFYA